MKFHKVKTLGELMAITVEDRSYTTVFSTPSGITTRDFIVECNCLEKFNAVYDIMKELSYDNEESNDRHQSHIDTLSRHRNNSNTNGLFYQICIYKNGCQNWLASNHIPFIPISDVNYEYFLLQAEIFLLYMNSLKKVS